MRRPFTVVAAMALAAVASTTLACAAATGSNAGANGPGPTTSASLPTGQTLCGASFEVNPGETFQQAFTRTDGYYGGLELVRVFYSGRPARWPGKVDVGNRPQVVSFKLSPREVLAGTEDAYLRDWFAAAPREQDIYWTYFHEPEENMAAGEFTAQDYRDAWKRLRGLADSAGNPRLRATLVLMSWSLDPKSGRNWLDYYPGRDVVQVLGWDIYNRAEAQGKYEDPLKMYERTIAVSKAEGLPFGVAETGSHLVPGDDGAQRAAWLRAMTRHLTESGALWVAYFDHDWPTGDFRLLDQAGRQAWSEFC